MGEREKLLEAVIALIQWRNGNSHRYVAVQNAPCLYDSGWNVCLGFHSRRYPEKDPTVNVHEANLRKPGGGGLAGTIFAALARAAEREADFKDKEHETPIPKQTCDRCHEEIGSMYDGEENGKPRYVLHSLGGAKYGGFILCLGCSDEVLKGIEIGGRNS